MLLSLTLLLALQSPGLRAPSTGEPEAEYSYSNITQHPPLGWFHSADSARFIYLLHLTPRGLRLTRGPDEITWSSAIGDGWLNRWPTEWEALVWNEDLDGNSMREIIVQTSGKVRVLAGESGDVLGELTPSKSGTSIGGVCAVSSLLGVERKPNVLYEIQSSTDGPNLLSTIDFRVEEGRLLLTRTPVLEIPAHSQASSAGYFDFFQLNEHTLIAVEWLIRRGVQGFGFRATLIRFDDTMNPTLSHFSGPIDISAEGEGLPTAVVGLGLNQDRSAIEEITLVQSSKHGSSLVRHFIKHRAVQSEAVTFLSDAHLIDVTPRPVLSPRFSLGRTFWNATGEGPLAERIHKFDWREAWRFRD